jgi:glucose-6-phosphate dehydrogenase assembly protein OpcA
MRFGAMVAKRAASVLEALVEASLPSVLVVGPGAHTAVIDSLVPAASCVLFDSSSTGVARTTELARVTSGRIDDLAFMSIRRWRDMAARFFDDPEHRGAILEIEKMVVRHARREDHAGASAEAELLVAWLGARLGWRADAATLRDARGRPVQVQIIEVARDNVLPGALVGLEITATLGNEVFLGRVVRESDGEHLSWELALGDTRSTRRFATPRRDDAELVERSIRSSLSAALLRETLEFARHWRAGE